MPNTPLKDMPQTDEKDYPSTGDSDYDDFVNQRLQDNEGYRPCRCEDYPCCGH